MITTARVRLAQELHDGIAQDLVALGYAVDAILATEDDEIKRHSLRSLRLDIVSLIDKVRIEIFDLRKENGFAEPINSQPAFKVELSKTFNEIIENAIQHSQASNLTITIADDGIGGAKYSELHHGLQGCGERISSLQGDFAVKSDFTGTTIEIKVPLESQ